MRHLFTSKQTLLISIRCLLLTAVFYTSSNLYAADTSAVRQLKSLDKSSLIMLAPDGTLKHAHKVDEPMVPASTMKVLTAFLALETWGGEHRFITDFTIDKNETLWVKGYGDPFLVSEEIDLIVSALKTKGLKKISAIGIDDNYFSSDIAIHGQSATNNPYDAYPGALVANFNTINVKRYTNRTYSAEAQTPLTQTMEHVASELATGTHRVSLKNKDAGSRYFAEILIAKLSEHGIETTTKIFFGDVSESQKPFYRHKNSRQLSEVVSAMLKYSNNFIANQLFLLLSVEANNAPANIQKSQKVVNRAVKQLFGWQDYSIIEGAGLSRDNRLSARQLTEVLLKFSPYRQLLSQQGRHIYVKTGTLKGVSTYAGYLEKSGQWLPFALMINQPVNYNFRKQVAQELLESD